MEMIDLTQNVINMQVYIGVHTFILIPQTSNEIKCIPVDKKKLIIEIVKCLIISYKYFCALCSVDQ